MGVHDEYDILCGLDECTSSDSDHDSYAEYDECDGLHDREYELLVRIWHTLQDDKHVDGLNDKLTLTLLAGLANETSSCFAEERWHAKTVIPTRVSALSCLSEDDRFRVRQSFRTLKNTVQGTRLFDRLSEVQYALFVTSVSSCVPHRVNNAKTQLP